MDLHGKPRYPSWTILQVTSLIGSNTITVKEPVDWQVGELIVIGPTSFKPLETEVFSITAVSADRRTLTLNASLQYDHRGFTEIFSNGDSYKIGAGVGLLSRNIKIIGGEYANQYSEMYGARVIVSDYSTTNTDGIPMYYKGFARISDIQFFHPGQYSRAAEDDFGYGILFSNLQDYNYTRPSYVRNSAFHHGFSAAIGILGSYSIPIEDNVIHHSIDFGIRLKGHSTIVKRNFVVLVYWGPTWETWNAEFNTDYFGAVDGHQADSFVLEDNFIAGAERLGLFYKGDLCDGDSLPGMNHSIKNNTIYSSMAGVVVLPDYYLETQGCIKIAGFTVFKSMHWGLYYQAPMSVIVENNTLIDNYVNVFTMVIQPATIEHIFSGKYYKLRNTHLIGMSKEFDCVKDIRPMDLNFEMAKKITAFGAGPTELGKIGMVWSNFLGASNMAPNKPWSGIKTYNALDGYTLVEDVIFSNFNSMCGYRGYALTSNVNNDDGQHPVTIRRVRFNNVDEASKIWIHRPNLGKITIWDCIDMDCDGLKKNLLNDLDGSFLGQKGTVISQSEFEWGSQQRGLGDFRIPKEALAMPNGSMIQPKEIYNYLGIVRDENLCSYISDWQAYKCLGIEHRMLMIESMDPDSLHRRLSPVAILSDNKYLDLINGPQGLYLDFIRLIFKD